MDDLSDVESGSPHMLCDNEGGSAAHKPQPVGASRQCFPAGRFPIIFPHPAIWC